MKKLGEVLLQEDPFTEFVLGNTAVARGMAEAGSGWRPPTRGPRPPR
jgi:hypothetical protein